MILIHNTFNVYLYIVLKFQLDSCYRGDSKSGWSWLILPNFEIFQNLTQIPKFDPL